MSLTTSQTQSLRQLVASSAPHDAIAQLCETLKAEGAGHKLFDARLLAKKYEMGLSLAKPASFDDVPKDQRPVFEEAYVAAAREAGLLFLKQNDFRSAFIYLHTIHELEPLKTAIEAQPLPAEHGPEAEAFIQLALYQGVHPAKGVQLLLNLNGICNTITALDQQFSQLPQNDREDCAAIVVGALYDALFANIERDILQRRPASRPTKSIREAIAGKEWLFAEANYHTDVSHLSSIVRFARSLARSSAMLPKAAELALYGSMLAEQYQYPAEPPFDDYYVAHQHFFGALLNPNDAEHWSYFQQRIVGAEPDEQILVAYVLVDLLVRVDRQLEAVEVAKKYLMPSGAPDFRQPFAELCHEAKAFDELASVAAEQDDVVTFLGAALAAKRAASSV